MFGFGNYVGGNKNGEGLEFLLFEEEVNWCYWVLREVLSDRSRREECLRG